MGWISGTWRKVKARAGHSREPSRIVSGRGRILRDLRERPSHHVARSIGEAGEIEFRHDEILKLCMEAQFVRCAIIELQRNGPALKCRVEFCLECWRRAEELIRYSEFLPSRGDVVSVANQHLHPAYVIGAGEGVDTRPKVDRVLPSHRP